MKKFIQTTFELVTLIVLFMSAIGLVMQLLYRVNF